MTRNGRYTQAGGSYATGEIDSLHYTYAPGTNRLALLDDRAPQATRDQGARGAASSGYQYDRNGNLTYDPGRGVTVSYNHLNLPRLADFGGGKRIEWTYDAGGRQLRKQVLEIGA